MHQTVRWASFSQYGSKSGRHASTNTTSSMANVSSIKSRAPKPIGLRRGTNERKSCWKGSTLRRLPDRLGVIAGQLWRARIRFQEPDRAVGIVVAKFFIFSRSEVA